MTCPACQQGMTGRTCPACGYMAPEVRWHERDDDIGWIVVIPPTCPSRGYESVYREGKMAAHTTVKGRGKVARALR